MLKGIDPLLTADVLKVLCEMGHGDEIAVVDANFTAASLGAGKPILQLAGSDLPRACTAVLSVFPLDNDVEQPVAFMKVCNSADGFVSNVQHKVIETVCANGTNANLCEPIERFAFYERIKTVYAIIQTSEMQPFGNFIFKKGVITLPK